MLYIFVFVATLLGTYLIRQVAIKKELLDHPNARSSHTTPTPKGGGLAIILLFYTILIYLFFQSEVASPLFFTLLSGLPIVIVSFIDDIYPLNAKVRFSIQLFSAILSVFFLGGVDKIDFVLFTLQGSWVNLLAIIGIIWLTNLYNFLDGIDGYAGSEALFVGLAAFLLFGNELALILAIAAAGFLVFNWHKASIFMGDVGSAPLGFIFAVLMLYDAHSAHFVAWLILLSLFWFDATYTLIRRAIHREKLSQAHKKHLYQRLTQAGFSHDKVVLMALVFNLGLLLMLFLLPENLYFYLFCLLIVLLYGLTKIVDRLKAFS